MVTPGAAANKDFYFQKIFGDADFIAAGELIIPPDGQKPTKSTKDNTFVRMIGPGKSIYLPSRHIYRCFMSLRVRSTSLYTGQASSWLQAACSSSREV